MSAERKVAFWAFLLLVLAYTKGKTQNKVDRQQDILLVFF